MGTTNTPLFIPGDLVISVYGDGADSGSYGDNQAAPIVLEQVTTAGVYVSQLELPQTTTISNGVTEYAVSGEYGSSSEGTLELSEDGESLVIMGYGVNAAAFNAGGVAQYGTLALAQSSSIPNNGSVTPVARVVADINAYGTVDSSTAVYNFATGNNQPGAAGRFTYLRSAYERFSHLYTEILLELLEKVHAVDQACAPEPAVPV